MGAAVEAPTQGGSLMALPVATLRTLDAAYAAAQAEPAPTRPTRPYRGAVRFPDFVLAEVVAKWAPEMCEAQGAVILDRLRRGDLAGAERLLAQLRAYPVGGLWARFLSLVEETVLSAQGGPQVAPVPALATRQHPALWAHPLVSEVGLLPAPSALSRAVEALAPRCAAAWGVSVATLETASCGPGLLARVTLCALLRHRGYSWSQIGRVTGRSPSNGIHLLRRHGARVADTVRRLQVEARCA